MSRIEQTKKEFSDISREFSDIKETSKEIVDSQKKTLDQIKSLDSLDQEIMDAINEASAEVTNEATGDYENRAERPTQDTKGKATTVGNEIKEGSTEAKGNKAALSGIGSSSDYGKEGISAAGRTADQIAQEYDELGSVLTKETEEADRTVAERKREIGR